MKIVGLAGALSILQPLADDQHPSAAIIRNLTAKSYDLVVPGGEKEIFPFAFTVDLNPADLRLDLVAVVASQSGNVYQVQAFNGTVSVVESPTSIFDPQM